MVCLNQRAEFVQHNLYTIDVDCGNRNCYSYEGFEHLSRNREIEERVGEERRLEYGQRMIKGGNGQNNNLNGNRDLIVLN